MEQYVLVAAHKESLGEFLVPVNNANVFEYSLSQKLHNETVELFEKKCYRRAATNCIELKDSFNGSLVEYYKSFLCDIHTKMNEDLD